MDVWAAFSLLGLLPIILFLWLKFSNISTQTIHAVAAPEECTDESDIVIVGSGVLGSALAAVLGRDGRRVTVVERDLSEPDRIVGELLQPGGCKALRQLGLEGAVAEIDACRMEGYVVHNAVTNTHVQLPYPSDVGGAIINGYAFHHGRFVMGLRKLAREENSVTMVEGTVTSLLEKEGSIVGVAYRSKDSDQLKYIKAKLTIVCDGCFSKFRKGLVKAPITIRSHFVGVVMQDCPQFTPDHAELVLTTSGGPVLIYQIGSHETRVLVDVREPLPRNMKGYLLDNIAPQLPDHIRGPFVTAVTSGRIRRMPASFLPPSPNPKSGVITLGDAFNMRHPLTGAGMTVALKDVAIWREMLRKVPDLDNREAVMECLKKFAVKRKSTHSFAVNILAQALYELFSATDEHLLLFREACFAYFQLGGMAVTGPVGLLSIVHPKPFILLGHFFAVAFYAIYAALTSVGLVQLPKGAYNGAAILFKACKIIIPLIWSEVRTLIT